MKTPLTNSSFYKFYISSHSSDPGMREIKDDDANRKWDLHPENDKDFPINPYKPDLQDIWGIMGSWGVLLTYSTSKFKIVSFYILDENKIQNLLVSLRLNAYNVSDWVHAKGLNNKTNDKYGFLISTVTFS